jgi:hypothetical protein
MTNDLKISPNFTIDDIHKIRCANYEVIKKMTHKEIIEHTRKEAQPILERLENMKRKKHKQQ